MKNTDELLEFLEKYPNPRLIFSSTLREGYVSCIGPVPTICGPEVHFSKSAESELKEILRKMAAKK